MKRRYGVCFSDGSIRIRLKHAESGRPLKYSSLVSTLCHELAHLRHFHHGPSFRAFYLEILAFARRSAIYQPGPHTEPPRPDERPPAVRARPPLPRGTGPIQLTLFG